MTVRFLRWLWIIIITGLGLIFHLQAQPDNDRFANRFTLNGAEVWFSAYLLDATLEAGEPNHFEPPRWALNSAWWTWTAPADGWVEWIALNGEEGGFAVYTGNQVEGLTLVTRAIGPRLPCFPVSAGVAYQLAVSQPTESVFAWPVVREFQLRFRPPVTNDAFADRIRLEGSSLVLAGHNAGATRELGEPTGEGFGLPATVWWEWTPPSSGFVSIRWDTSFFGSLMVFRGSLLENLIPVPLIPGYGDFWVDAGDKIQLAVGSYDTSLTGIFSLRLTVSPLRIVEPAEGADLPDRAPLRVRVEGIPEDVTQLSVWIEPFLRWDFAGRPSELILSNVPPGNLHISVQTATLEGRVLRSPTNSVRYHVGADAFAAALTVKLEVDDLGGDFAAATIEANEPSLPQPAIGGTVWWRWVAPASGPVTLDNLPGPSVARQVFTGSELNELTLVPFEDGADETYVRVRFHAEAGQTYWLRLWHFGGEPGWGATHFTFLPQAANDDFARAEKWIGAPPELQLPRLATTCEPGEPGPCGPETGSRWYEWTAPASGHWRLRLESDWNVQGRYALTVFTGTSLDSLRALTTDSTQVEAVVQQGTTYRLRVQTPNDLPATVELRLVTSLGVFPANDDWANRAPLPGDEGELLASNVEATREPGEHVNERTLWWEWTAPADGGFLVDVSTEPEFPTPWAPLVAFFTGESAETLELREGQLYQGHRSSIAVHAGESLTLGVFGGNAGTEGIPVDFTLRYRFLPTAGNDAFAGRLTLAGTHVATRGTNWTATVEAGEPVAAGGPNQHTLWWEWVAPASGQLHVRSEASRLAVYRGLTLANLELLANTGGAFGLTNGIHVPVTQGVTYQVQVGDTTAALIDPEPPRAGLGPTGFALALDLTSLNLKSPTNGAVWSGDVPLTFELEPLSPALDGDLLAVTYFRATNAAGRLNAVELGTATNPPFSLLRPELFPGEHVVQARASHVGGGESWSPPVRLRITPVNDAFAKAQPMTGREWAVPALVSGGSRETNEPAGLGTNSTVWFSWKPPVAGTARVAFSTAPNRTYLNVYTGTTLENLVRLPGAGDRFAYTFSADPANPYFFRVSWSGTAPTGGLVRGNLLLSLDTTYLSITDAKDTFALGAPVHLRVQSTEPPDTLAAIDLVADEQSLVSFLRPPYEYVWTPSTPGLHRVVAYPRLQSGENLRPTEVSLVVIPPNDDFSRREVVPVVPSRVEGTVVGASPDDGVSTLGEVWYTWRAPADGLLFVKASGNNRDLGLELFTGVEFKTLERQSNRLSPTGPFWLGIWAVTAGVDYQLAVTQFGFTDSPQPFELDFIWRGPAENDDFADRIPLSGTEGDATGNLILATHEAGEPDHGNEFPPRANTVWWTWTPPADGVFEISFPDHNAPADAVRPYRGGVVTALTPVVPLGNPPPFGAGSRWYTVAAGQPVQLVLALATDSLENLRWHWRFLRPPPNDDFADRISLTGRNVIVTASSIGATREATDPVLADAEARTLWWSWTPPADGEGRIGLTAVDHPLEISIYRGDSAGGLTWLTGTGSGGVATFEARGGETYQVMVGSREPVGGPLRLDIELRTAPANDQFAQRQRLSGSQVRVEGASWRATREFREPYHGDTFAGRSVWYGWRAPADGEVRLQWRGDWGPALLAVYEGEQVDALKLVTSTTTPTVTDLTFMAQAGREYQVVVDGAFGASGAFQLRLDQGLTLAPFVELQTDAAGLLHVRVTALSPGRWILEAGDLMEPWSLVMELPSGAGVFEQTLEWPEQATVWFYRVRRLD